MSCYACRKDGVYDHRGYHPRAAVKAQVSFEPYVLSLCEPHLAQLQRELPRGSVQVVETYSPRRGKTPAAQTRKPPFWQGWRHPRT